MNPVFQHFDIPKANKLQQQLIIRIAMNVRTETNLRQDFQKRKVGMQVFRITKMLKKRHSFMLCKVVLAVPPVKYIGHFQQVQVQV